MGFQFLNQFCPVCGKEISPYDYSIKGMTKYHTSCLNKTVVVGCVQGRYLD